MVEQEATSNLENILSQINGIKGIYSVSNEGQGLIEITFDRNADIDLKRFEVASAIRQLYPRLNPKISYPLIEQRGRETENKKPLLIYRINAALAPFQIRKTVIDLFTTELSQIQGVKSVDVNGGEDLQITIAYNYAKLNQFDISPQQIGQLVSESFQTIYPGITRTSNGENMILVVKHSLIGLEQIENLLIASKTANIRIKDIAKVYFEESKPQQYFRINGLNSISLVVYSAEGTNRLSLAQNIRRVVNSLKSKLPSGYHFQLQHDDTEYISAELNKNFLRSGLAIAILTLLILLTYRSWLYLSILISSLLVNLLLTSLIAFVLGISIHLYTIAGITISFGMMIDNLIIMLDHLKRKRNDKIFRAILGATLTTMMALLMVLILPAEDRNNLSEFAVIVSVALGSSILVASIFVPAIYSSLLKVSIQKRNSNARLRSHVIFEQRYFQLISIFSRWRKTMLLTCVLAFGLPVFLLPSRWEGNEWYNETIGSDFYQEVLRPYVDPLLGGALRPFVRSVYERGGFREPERVRLIVNAELPHGNTIDDMNRITIGVEKYLQSVSGIENFVTNVYSGQYAVIQITFNKAFENGSLPFRLKNQLIARSLDWNGISWNIFGVGQGFNNSSSNDLPSFRAEMRGYNYKELEQLAEKLAKKLVAHPRIQKVNTNERLSWNEKPSQEWILEIHETSVQPASIAQSVSLKTGQVKIRNHLNVDGNSYPVSIQLQDQRIQLYEIMNNYIVANEQVLKLDPIASITLQKTASAIHKQDRQYIRDIGFDYFGSNKFGSEFLTEMLKEMELEMPAGYTAKKVNWDWGIEKLKRQYGILLILLIAIYFLTAILFENTKQPLYIIFSVPLSFIGLFLAFAWGSYYFDQGGYAAFILLGGLTVNATIFIINDLNNTTHRNYNRAVIKAVAGKMLPILLTTFSTCLGLVPFLIGGQNEIFWFSLSIGSIGGLLVSIPFTVLVLPTFLWNNG